MAKITIVIDGRKVSADDGERLLDVCRREHIFIPTLCDHDSLKPYGACRICMVELQRGDWSKMITSCNYPVKDGQIFRTDSEKVLKQRKMIMEWTLARSSETPEIVALAKQLGVASSRFPTKNEGCILCGMCIRACSEIVEANAISFSERGPMRKVASPFYDEANDCIGCGTCAFVCPTRYIEVTESENTREFPLWHVKFDMARCKKCGQKVAPKKQIEFMKKRSKGLPEGWFDLCQNCRK